METIKRILAGLIVVLTSLFFLVIYIEMRNPEIQEVEVKPNYVVDWGDYGEQKEIPEFNYEVEFQKVERDDEKGDKKENVKASDDVAVNSKGWIETDDSDLINYVSKDETEPIKETITYDNYWPVYSGFTMIAPGYVDKMAPNEIWEVTNANAKTYMKYQTLGYGAWNIQGHLARNSAAYTGNHQIRMIDGRMLIAVGSYYTRTIGTYVDVLLSDGTVLACIVGDQKSDHHTDPTNRYHAIDYSVIEFIVDSQGTDSTDYSLLKQLEPAVAGGNYSGIPELSSLVTTIRVYDKVYETDMNDMSNDSPDLNETRNQ